jgi:DNA uptake protein ComE-like DNA-binding protein
LAVLQPEAYPVPDSLKAFDPDTVSQMQLVRWGLPAVIAGRWLKYRNKIGGFKSVSQIQGIYGMPDSVFRIWKDSIRLKPVMSGKKQRHCPPEMDLNYADSTMLMRLHGIGKVLSRRIIRYRIMLGGFVWVSQLREVYGLPDSTYHHIRDKLYVDRKFEPNRILLDSATYQQLYDHPYINSKEATAILRYRDHHPGFVCLEDILALDSAARIKMKPYVAESCISSENEPPG